MRPHSLAALFAAFVVVSLAAQPATPPPTAAATDIFLVRLSDGLASLKTAKPEPASTVPGYDNQPMFSADGQRLLFAANHDGKQTDIYLFDRKTGRTSQLTATPENENSPTWLPDGVSPAGGFSVVRTEADKTQRLWRFDAQGRNPQLVLTDVKPVGYHAWVDANTLALFVLGPPSTLRIARVDSGKATTVTEAIGRSLQRIPGTRLVSFVQRGTDDAFWIKQLDVTTEAVESLVKAGDGNAEHDTAWMPDGKTVLISSGSKVLAWTRGAPAALAVYDAAAHGLGNVSRIAVSPQSDAIAIVVDEAKK